ncbi:hypothetical protein ACBZ91_09510 [Vibrio natriegens]|uniref:hypothetical protein n=1 Tax=Vibrio natriegens TaxID=691 RepID=UPI001FBB63E1|nr:hypothetical protein [Vibrio natriegens]
MTSNFSSKVGLVALLILSSCPAYAYLDPGTGSVILQVIIATVVAGLATMRLWWYKLLNLFSVRKSELNEDKTSQSTTADKENK